MPLFADLAAMQARFEDRDLLQLSDQDNTGAIDAARIDAKLDSADATIRGYVATRHKDVDSLAGNAVLTDIACDLAFALLWRSDPPQWVTDRRKAADQRLKDIASGALKLDAGEEQAAPRPGQIVTTSDERRFGRDRLGSY